MDRIKKEAMVERIKEIFSTSMAAIVIDYKGLEANETVTLRKFAKKNEKLKIASGILVTGGKVSMLDAAQLEALAKLPSKEELISKLLFLLNAPITQLVRTIHEVPASFVRTLSAITESKQ